MQQSFFATETGTSLPVDASIGSRIRARRKELKLTQDELGDAVGIPGDVVSKHERGVFSVGAERLLAYARALGVDAQWLAGEAPGGKPGPRSGAVRAVSGTVPRAVIGLLNDGRCNPVTDAELDHLTRYLVEGGSEELIDLEIQLLLHRAGRDQTDEAIDRFRAAVRRKRKGTKPPTEEPRSAKTEKPELTR